LPGAPEIAELLTILPKPDLHVHMGSCMSTEFLVVASLVGLLRHEWSDDRFSSLSQLVALLHRLRSEKGSAVTHFIQELSPSPVFIRDTETPLKDETWIKALARHTAKHLGCQLACDGPLTSGYGIFRAILHADLGIPDYLEIGAAQKKLDLKTPLELALFAVQHSIAINNTWKVDDIIRVYLLTLATLYQNNKGVKASLNFGVKGSEVDFLDFFRSTPSSKAVSASSSIWRAGHQYFYSSESQSGFTVGQFRGRGWRLDGNHVNNLILTWPCVVEADDHSQAGFDPKLFPIEFELATGLHSTSLVKYLQGCEFSGAEKLRHPFLIHLYAQQTVMEFVRMGVFYAELKGSPDGFIEHDWGFEFSGVCRCLVEAFAQAQASVLDVYRVCRRPRNRLTQEGQSDPGADPCWLGHSLGERFSHSNLREMFTEGPNQTNRSFLKRRLPCKVSLVFVGKRHKSTREMILEAAAAAVMRPSGERPVRNAREFVEREMARCRVVGFDLAGQESDNPPELFVEEFSRLSRLHIPFTVHAGENAPAKFIEDAILLLQAKRIGHGLALAEDQGLMVRVREDRVCVELCPVCNHQTSHFLPGNSKGPGRRYPLKDYLEYGLLVAINTDNPIISNTNLVREYFQASYAYDDKGLSVWEALRVMRMGYVCSFLRLPERRAMIETVEQFLFDLFSREDCVAYLREIADLQRSRRKDARIKPPEAGGRA
jgi:adenosine deaminase